jgi:hypothetical protein
MLDYAAHAVAYWTAEGLRSGFGNACGSEGRDADQAVAELLGAGHEDWVAHGEYRIKRVIQEIYDEMQRAMETGVRYQTRLDPPPADPRVAHPPQQERTER